MINNKNIPGKNINIKYLVDALSELIALMEHETELVTTNRSEQIQRFQTKKKNLLSFIEKQNWLTNKELINTLPFDQKEYLMSMAQKLQEVSLVNQQELSKEVHFRQELIQVVSFLINKNAGGLSYTKDGKVDRSKGRSESPSISINDKI